MIKLIIIKPKTPPPIAKIKVEGSVGAEDGDGPGAGDGPGGPGGDGPGGDGPGGDGPGGDGPGGDGLLHPLQPAPVVGQFWQLHEMFVVIPLLL